MFAKCLTLCPAVAGYAPRMNRYVKALIGLAFGLLGQAAAADPVVRAELETYRAAAVVNPRSTAKPIGAIDFSAQAVEGRRLGPWQYDVHRSDGTGRVILLDDGSYRGSSERVRYDKWGRRCATTGDLTVCKGDLRR